MANIDEYDLLDKVRTTLQAAVWPGTSTKIFGSEAVFISPAEAYRTLQMVRSPLALIKPEAGSADADEPFLWDITFSTTILNHGDGSPHGQFAVMGGHQTTGKGLLIVCRQVIREIGKLGRETVPIRCVAQSATQVVLVEGKNYYAYRDLLFKATVSMADES